MKKFNAGLKGMYQDFKISRDIRKQVRIAFVRFVVLLIDRLSLSLIHDASISF